VVLSPICERARRAGRKASAGRGIPAAGARSGLNAGRANARAPRVREHGRVGSDRSARGVTSGHASTISRSGLCVHLGPEGHRARAPDSTCSPDFGRRWVVVVMGILGRTRRTRSSARSGRRMRARSPEAAQLLSLFWGLSDAMGGWGSAR